MPQSCGRGESILADVAAVAHRLVRQGGAVADIDLKIAHLHNIARVEDLALDLQAVD